VEAIVIEGDLQEAVAVASTLDEPVQGTIKFFS
jgi:hypothetical protein